MKNLHLSFVGVILFVLLSGTLPFYGTGDKVYESIKKGKPSVSKQ